MIRLIALMVFMTSPALAFDDSPIIVGADGEYLGRLNNNPHDYESIANPHGPYGSIHSDTSINNPYSRYGHQNNGIIVSPRAQPDLGVLDGYDYGSY